jgi:ribosomal-protein-alanine N-acetyltransferase
MLFRLEYKCFDFGCSIVKIESERLIIENFSENDVASWAEIERNPRVRRYIDGKTLSYDQASAYVYRNIDEFNKKGFSRYAVRFKRNGRLIGMCGFLEEAYGIDFGYRYAPAFWGMGIGFEAAKIVLEVGMTRPKPITVFGIVAENNFGSIRILERLDFRYIGQTTMHGLKALKYSFNMKNIARES